MHALLPALRFFYPRRSRRHLRFVGNPSPTFPLSVSHLSSPSSVIRTSGKHSLHTNCFELQADSICDACHQSGQAVPVRILILILCSRLSLRIFSYSPISLSYHPSIHVPMTYLPTTTHILHGQISLTQHRIQNHNYSYILTCVITY